MIILTDSNGDETLVPDRELIPMLTELRDLLQRQRSEAIAQERQRCAGIVDSYIPGHHEPEGAVDILRAIVKEITDGE